MSCRRLWRLSCAAAICGTACIGTSKTPADKGLTDYQRQMKAESIAVSNERDTVFQRRMRDLARRTLLVPTDSLARLYGSVRGTAVADLWRIRQAVGCQDALLMAKHGVAAFKRANERMKDSLRTGGVNADETTETFLSAPGPLMTLGLDTCGETIWPKPGVPDSLSNYPERTAARPR